MRLLPALMLALAVPTAAMAADVVPVKLTTPHLSAEEADTLPIYMITAQVVFAAECNVIKLDDAKLYAVTVINTMAAVVEGKLWKDNQQDEAQAYMMQFDQGMLEMTKLGVAHAAKRHACAYWRTHPDARKTIVDAMASLHTVAVVP